MQLFVVPPYMLEALAEHGSPAQRQAAAATLESDRRFRAARPAPPAARASAAEAAPGTPQRTVRTAEGKEELDGPVVRREGEDATGDPAADEAYDGLGATYALYWDVFRRDSIDGRGLPLDAVVHYGTDYDNAFWDGERMVFGDGDGETFNRFTLAVDVVGHELTHGVTDATARLEYRGQSGALNESVSDCFGSMVKQRGLGQAAADADWLIGAGLLAEGIDGIALRSMAAPGTAYDDPRLGGRDPQPAHMDDFVETADDDGGVHINSGIPNKAFHLAATGIGGEASEGAGRVWYAVLTGGELGTQATFAEFARLTETAAADVLGEAQAGVVRDAWAQV